MNYVPLLSCSPDNEDSKNDEDSEDNEDESSLPGLIPKTYMEMGRRIAMMRILKVMRRKSKSLILTQTMKIKFLSSNQLTGTSLTAKSS